MPDRLSVADAQREWSPDGVYLNTASYGLPPDAGWAAMQQALGDWRGGRTSWERWGDSTDGSRAMFAEMVGVAPDGEVRHQGPCSMTAFPWDFEKPGGQGH